MLSMDVPVLVVDGVVKLPPEANGAVVVGGSNATAYAAYFSARAGVRAAIHHDCGIGRDEAGVSGLPWADQHGMAMAAVATDSARAGDAADMVHRGIISRVNKLAATCGVETGQTVAQAVELLKSAPWPHADVEAPVEERTFVDGILCIGSISFATPEDAGLVVASGSHGGSKRCSIYAFLQATPCFLQRCRLRRRSRGCCLPSSSRFRWYCRRYGRRGFGVHR